MGEELKRLDVQNLGRFIAACQFLGALGLLIGFTYKPLLISASCGLALLMICGLAVRIRSKDSLLVSLPALLYLILNAFIFTASVT